MLTISRTPNPSLSFDSAALAPKRPATPPASASLPAPAAPPQNAPVAQRMIYCNELLTRMETANQGDHARASCMELLASQISLLPSEKSGTDKAKEVTVRAATAMGKMFAEKKFASQKQLRKQYETPQATIFNALMHGLANPNKLSQSVVVGKILGLKQTEHQPVLTAFKWSDLERRRLNGTAWKELIMQASALKPERQSKMLDLFATNFNDIPQSASASNRAAKETMIAAYEESFIGLTGILAQLRGPAGPDGWNKQQAKAFAILKEFAVLLPEEARHRVMTAVGNSAKALPSGSPLSARLTALESVLKSPPAAQAHEVQSLPEAPEAGSTRSEWDAYLKALMTRIEKPKGDLDQWANDMLGLARQLPNLDAQTSTTAPVIRAAARMVRATNVDNLLPGRVAHRSIVHSQLDRVIKDNERSQQGMAFEFLMTHLDDPKARTKMDLDFGSNIVFAKRRLEFNAHDIDRRIAAAPVWEELISQAGVLKQERQVMLLERFRENFDMFNFLPYGQVQHWEEKKIALVDAFSQSLVNLCEAFLALGVAERSDSTSQAQQDAIAILRDYGGMLSEEKQSSLRQKINEVASAYKRSAKVDHPGILDLQHIGDGLRNSKAP